jgi:hypothetical protein
MWLTETQTQKGNGMRYYPTIKAARGALALDTGFDPFISGGWGRCTKAALADAGYPVDPARAQSQCEEERKRKEEHNQREADRQRRDREWQARPTAQKYKAAEAILGGGAMSMIEIGEREAHVHNDRGVCIVEPIEGKWVARLPHAGERVWV